MSPIRAADPNVRRAAFSANHHLRQSLVFLDMPTMQQPELYIGGSYDLFDDDSRLIDADMTQRFEAYMERFVTWTTRHPKNHVRPRPQHRAAVVDVACDLVLANGDEATSVDAVGRRAGVAKGTVYLSFTSKQHLDRAIEEEFDILILDRLHAAPQQRHHKLRGHCRRVVHGARHRVPASYRLLAYRKGARVAERKVDATLGDDPAGVVRDRGVADAEVPAVFLIAGVTPLADLDIRRCDGHSVLARQVDRFVTADVAQKAHERASEHAHRRRAHPSVWPRARRLCRTLPSAQGW